MKEATIDDFLHFFRNLDFKSKIEVLNQFTLELKKVVDTIAEDQEKSGEDQVIDELFGIWKDEEDLTQETVIDRTVSDREINLN